MKLQQLRLFFPELKLNYNLIFFKSFVIQFIPLLILLGCLFYMFSPMLNSGFSIIDDHEIVIMSGIQKPLNIKQFTEKAIKSEFTEVERYRPLYKILRAIECFFANETPFNWHLDRLVLGALTAVLLFLSLNLFLSSSSSGLITFLLFCGKQNEIWGRLGAGEAFATLLLLMAVYRLLVLLEKRRDRIEDLGEIALLILAMGFIKENYFAFIVLFPVSFLLLRRLYPSPSPLKMKELSMSEWCLIGFYLLVSGYLTIKLLQASKNHILLEPRHFIPAVTHENTRKLLRNLIFVFVPIGFALIHLWRFPNSIRLRFPSKPIQIILTVSFLALAVTLSQWVFYGELIRFHERYLVPGILGPILISALCFHLLESHGIKKSTFLIPFLLLLGFAADWLHTTRLITERESYNNNAFQTTLNNLTALKAKFPSLPIVFCTNFWTQEQVGSTWRYLTKKWQSEPIIYMRMDTADGVRETAWDRRGARQLKDMLENNKGNFRPATAAMTTSKCCIGVYFSGHPGLCRYDNYIRMPDLYQN